MAQLYTFWDRVARRIRWHLSDPFDERVRAPLRRLRNASRSYRPVFVGGASGSGTSVLALSLGQRFDCAGVIYESNFQVARDSFLYVPHIDEFPSAAAYQDYMTPKPSWSVEQGRRDLLDCYRRNSSGASDVVVDKGPDIHLLRAEYLQRCFPDSAMLVIFRDPVANVEGLRRKWKAFGSGPLSATIRFWAESHEALLRAADAFPKWVHAVEYEALVEEPDATLTELGRRLGFAPARRRRRLLSKPNVEGQGIRNVRGSEIGYVQDANQRARSRLETHEIAEIESALAPLEARLRKAPFTIRAADLREARRAAASSA